MAPPPDDYGWAFLDAQRATASADGPSGSLQFRWGSEDLVPGQFSGSEDLVFYANSVGHLAWDGDSIGGHHGTGSQLYLYGDMFVTGAIYADSYTVRSITTTEVEVSGSTTFGDSADDTHQRTGSFEVNGQSNFSGDVLIQSDGSSDQPVLTLYSISSTGTEAAELDFRRYHDSSFAAGDNLGEVRFRGAESAGYHTAVGTAATIIGEVGTGTWVQDSSHPGRLLFYTTPEGSTAGTKWVDLDSDGALNISGAVGPLTGSGEIHASRLVSNDIFTSGSIGIGTTDPLAEPNEKNDLVIGDHTIPTGKTGNRGMTIASTATGMGTIRFAPSTAVNNGEGWIDYSGNTNKMRFGTNGLNTRMTIGAAGNVGIGVGDPDTTLEVMSTTAQLKLSYDGSNYASIQANSAGTLILSPSSEYFIVNADTATYLRSDLIKLGRGGATDTTITFDGSTNDMSIVYDESAKTLAFDTSDLFIDAANARVGIGVADPDSHLEVFGTSNQLKLSYDASNSTTLSTSGPGHLTVTPSGGRAFIEATDYVVLDTPLVKIGENDTSDVTLDLRGSTNDLSIVYDESAKKLAFDTSDLVIDAANARVGIATASPAMTLDVNGTDGDGGVNITGSLDVTADAVVQGALWVDGPIAHIGDSDTKMIFGTDTYELRVGNVRMISATEDDSQDNVTINTNNADVDFIVDGDTNDKIFHVQAAAEGSGPAEMVHISGTLGPVSGSGEVHVAKIVANDARITGSIRAGYTGINGGNVLLITNSGSSDAIRITGGMTASHAVHVEHLYTNDLYVSGTAYGITVDRANYASASDPSTTRTYSPTGLETSGYLKVSGSSILGDTALDTVMVTGSFEASGPAHFNGTADFYGAARHHGTLRADDAVTFTDTLFAQGGVVFGNQSTDTAQVTGSFEVSGPSHFTSEVHAEGQVTVGGEAFLNGAVNVSGSTILGAANTTHQITGSFEVAGPANFTSVVNAEADLTVAGNTTLGNNSEDTVQITGSLEVSNTVNATELINAEKGVTAHNHLNVTGSLEASGATFLTSTATVGGLLTVNDSTILGDAGANEHQITGSVDIAHTLDVEGVLTVNDSTFLGEANENVHQITGSVHMGLTLDVTGAVGVGGTLTSYSDFRATDNTHIGASNGNTHQVSGTVHVSNTMDVSGAVGVMTDLRVWGNSTFGKAAGYSHQFTGSLDLANNINVTGTINAAGAIKSYDTLDVASGTFSMPDNTSAKILVADGNSYQEVAVSGDVTIASNGAVSIANDAVDTNQIADDAIEAGQIADGAIGNAAVDNASLRADKLDITNSTDIGEAIADDDVMIVGNTSASANRKSAMSRVKAYTKTDVGTIGTAEASKAIIVDNNVAINGGLTSVTGSKDLYFKDVKATSNLISDGGLLVSGSATVAAGLTSSYGMSIPDHEMLRIGSSSDLKISHNTTNTLFINQAGHLRFDNQATGKHIQMDLAADDATTQFQVRNNAGTELFSIDTVGTAVTGTLEVSSTTNLQATNLYGAASGSSTLAIQGSASFGAPVDISGDLVFHAATIAGRIDIKVNDGAGADTAIQIGKNGIVTKIGDDTPSDGQYLSWDNTAGKVAWADGLTSWGMSGSDNHYSSTELRTSGDLKVSGSVTFAGAQTGGYSVDGAEIKFGADEEIKLIHNADSGLILKRTATGADVPVTLTLQTGETQISNNNVIGKIQWQAPDESDGSDGTLVCAAIEALATDSFSATVNSTKLAFKTATDGAAVRHLELHADGKLQGYASNSATWSVTADGTGSYQQLAIADKLLHTGDADTGIFFEADSIKLHAGTNSQPQITINGTGVVINEESNSLDFRIESNQQTHMFAIDGGDNEITIANGFGSSGITIAQTGSMAMDGHLHAVGEIVCGSDLHVSDDAFITDDLNVGGDIDVVGSVTAPSANFTNCGVADDITHIGDPNTKITFGTDQIDLIAGGITMLTLDETTTNAIHFFAGSGSGGGTIYESGNLKVDGDLYLGGADIRDGGGGVLLSFDGAGIIDNACEFSQDITIATSAAAQLSLKSDSGQSSVDFYGRGDSMSDGDNVGALRFYGTEANDGANSALTAMMIVETAESGWAYGSSLATRMRFQVGRDGETGVHDGLTIDGSVANVSYPHIGIGTTTPTYKLSVQASVGSSYIAQVRQESSNASAACLRIRSANASGGNFITFSDDGGSNKGHITVNGSTVTYGAFTGYHPAALPAADHDTGYEYGTIVKIASVDSTTHEKSVGYNVEKTATSQDKAVLGVCAGKMSESLNDDGSPDRESGLHQIFAVGDGHILACSEGGNIETGDFICSSNTAGYGMLQSDDLLHNYTVARASEPVDWSAEDSNTKLIACTYHAG